MLEAFRNEDFAKGPFAALYELIAPAAVDVMSGGRLVRIDRHLSKYFLFQTLWALFKSRFSVYVWRERGGFETAAILEAWRHLPGHVLRSERNKRAHLSHLLSRNEVDRDYACNRRLFVRLGQGWYQFNAALAVRRRDGAGECWLPVLNGLNLRLVAEGAAPSHWDHVNAVLDRVRQAPVPTPIAGQGYARQMAAQPEEDEAWQRKMDEVRRARRAGASCRRITALGNERGATHGSGTNTPSDRRECGEAHWRRGRYAVCAFAPSWTRENIQPGSK